MEITITWTKLIVLFVAWHGLRYIYHTYMKYVTGCCDPFDPTVPFDAAIAAEHHYQEYWFKLLREQERTARLEAELGLARHELKLYQGRAAPQPKVKQRRKSKRIAA